MTKIYGAKAEERKMSMSLSIEDNLKHSVDSQDSTISDIFLVLKCNHDVSMRLSGLFFETNALRKESDSIYRDFYQEDPHLILDDNGKLEETLTRIIEKEINSLQTIQGFLKLVKAPDYPFWFTKWLVYGVIRQQKKFIASTDRLRAFIREHDVDAEDLYDGPFDNANDLIEHLNS